MDKIYNIENSRIKVRLDKGIVHIVNDEELLQMLSADKESGTSHLVSSVKTDYLDLYQKDLQITDDSLIVEIWGHVYFEYFMIVVNKLIEKRWIDKLSEIVIKRSEVIDCGEKSLDNNRVIWDMIAPFKNIIARMLPDKLMTEQISDQKGSQGGYKTSEHQP